MLRLHFLHLLGKLMDSLFAFLKAALRVTGVALQLLDLLPQGHKVTCADTFLTVGGHRQSHNADQNANKHRTGR